MKYRIEKVHMIRSYGINIRVTARKCTIASLENAYLTLTIAYKNIALPLVKSIIDQLTGS